MKRTLLTVILALAVLSGVYSIAGANTNTLPHSNYRVGYSEGPSGCGGTASAACHSITKGSFLPAGYSANASVNYRNFCLSCHTPAGEAKEKSVGRPSTNTYLNLTTLVEIPAPRGTSHKFDVTPTGGLYPAGAVAPTGAIGGHMPSGNIMCSTCHGTMDKSGEQDISWLQTSNSSYGGYKRYAILGYANTLQYLSSRYLRVYMVPSGTLADPSDQNNGRGKKTYLVSPTQYTYKNQSALLIFNSAQSPTAVIYVDIAQPYFRESNAANAMCLECHGNRVDTAVTHSGGTGAKDNHPVTVNYGNNQGLHQTIKPSAGGNVILEGGKVYCTSCHKMHNAPSDNGMIMREADGYTLCGDCHKTKLDGYSSAGSGAVNVHNGSKHSSPTVCLDCHVTHGSRNIMLVRNKIYRNNTANNVTLRNISGTQSLGNGAGTSVCEVCHTKTGHHKVGVSDTHHAGENCTKCHLHETGFQLVGGAVSCDGCHGYPPGQGGKYGPTNVTPYWNDTTGGEHVSHMTHLAAAPYNLSIDQTCAMCHGATIPTDTHNQNKDTAYMVYSNWSGQWGAASFSTGGTAGKTSVNDDSCTNVKCHGGSGTRYWRKASACNSCHFYPDGGNDWHTYNGHTIRDDVYTAHMKATGYNKDTDTYDAMTADSTRCGKCHPHVLSNHQNGTINVVPNSSAACGGGNFTFNLITTRHNVTCSNVSCHKANKTTPNWWE